MRKKVTIILVHDVSYVLDLGDWIKERKSDPLGLDRWKTVGGFCVTWPARSGVETDRDVCTPLVSRVAVFGTRIV